MASDLKYVIDKRALAAQYEFHNSSQFSKIQKSRLFDIFLWIVLCFLLIYIAVDSERLFIIAIAVLLLMVRIALWRPNPIWEIREIAIKRAIDNLQEKEVQLIVDDNGIEENIGEIKSIVPWSSVLGYTFFKDILFIELSNNLWAVIPKNTLKEGSSSIDQVIEHLKRNDIPEKNRPETS